MENYKRNHFLYVIDNIISSFSKIIIPLVVLAVGKLRTEEPGFLSLGITVVGFLLILIAVVAYSVVKWLKTVYYIKDNFIVIREGIFVVKRREIPFSKVQTINVSQNIKQRIFHIAALKIDTGNSSQGSSEISIVIGRVEAELLREEIMNSRDMDETKDTEGIFRPEAVKISKQFDISPKELLLVGLTSNAVLAGLAFIGSIYTILNDYLESIINNTIKKLDIFVDMFDFRSKTISTIILTILAIILVFIIFSFAASVIGTYIKYYGFSVKRESKNIIINYGLLEKKNYILPIAKIKAVYIRQNLLRQIFGLCAIYVESIGYGNEKGEEALLYPIAGLTMRVAILKELLPEFLFEGELIRVPRSTLKRFIISSALLPLLLSIAITFIFKYGYVSLLIIPVFILKWFMEYKNSAIAMNDRLLCMCNKAFTKSIAMVAIKDIQSSSESSNYFQRRKKLFNYEVSIHSNTFGKIIKVKNLDGNLKERLLGIII